MISLKDQELIHQKFAQELVSPVKMDFFTEQESDLIVPDRKPCTYCKPTREMLQELAALSDLVSLRVHIWESAHGERSRFGVDRIPATVLRSRDGAILKFYGMPGGTGFPGFVESITDISRRETLLSNKSAKSLRRIMDAVTVRVFVTPNCPYSPQVARVANQLALTNPKIEPEVIEANEFPELAQRYGVSAVPVTVIADRITISGALDESLLVEQVMGAVQRPVNERSKSVGPTTPVSSPQDQEPARRGERRDSGLFIP
jgi:glutaredoxin-like protein